MVCNQKFGSTALTISTIHKMTLEVKLLILLIATTVLKVCHGKDSVFSVVPGDVFAVQNKSVSLEWHQNADNFVWCYWEVKGCKGDEICPVDQFLGYEPGQNLRHDISTGSLGWVFTNRASPCRGGIQRERSDRDGSYQMVIEKQDGSKLFSGYSSLKSYREEDMVLLIEINNKEHETRLQDRKEENIILPAFVPDDGENRFTVSVATDGFPPGTNLVVSKTSKSSGGFSQACVDSCSIEVLLGEEEGIELSADIDTRIQSYPPVLVVQPFEYDEYTAVSKSYHNTTVTVLVVVLVVFAVLFVLVTVLGFIRTRKKYKKQTQVDGDEKERLLKQCGDGKKEIADLTGEKKQLEQSNADLALENKNLTSYLSLAREDGDKSKKRITALLVELSNLEQAVKQLREQNADLEKLCVVPPKIEIKHKNIIHEKSSTAESDIVATICGSPEPEIIISNKQSRFGYSSWDKLPVERVTIEKDGYHCILKKGNFPPGEYKVFASNTAGKIEEHFTIKEQEEPEADEAVEAREDSDTSPTTPVDVVPRPHGETEQTSSCSSAPVFEEAPPPKILVCYRGDFTVDVIVTGNPKPEVKWYKMFRDRYLEIKDSKQRHVKSTGTSHTLTVENVYAAATYKVIATNEFGTDERFFDVHF